MIDNLAKKKKNLWKNNSKFTKEKLEKWKFKKLKLKELMNN